MADVVIVSARDGALTELLHADDLVLIRETIKGFRGKFLRWKEALESKGLKVNLGKTKVIVSSSKIPEISVQSDMSVMQGEAL